MKVLSTYHSSPVKILLPLLFGLAAIEAPLILILTRFVRDGTTPFFFTISVFVLPAVAIIVFFLLWVKIEITERDIRFYRFGRTYMIVPFANHTFQHFSFFGNNNQQTDISNKYLRVISPNGRIKNIRCYAITQKKFDEFISEVLSLSEKKTAFEGNNFNETNTQSPT